jgi:hypothetical protein
MTEGLKAYRIPEGKRNEYFDFADKFKDNVVNVNDSNWQTHHDPIVVIDTSEFLFSQVMAIKLFMNRIGAKDVTESISPIGNKISIKVELDKDKK